MVEETADYCDLICPYCNYHHRDMWEAGLEIETETEWECCKCDRTFIAIKEVTVMYIGKAKNE